MTSISFAAPDKMLLPTVNVWIEALESIKIQGSTARED